MSIRKVLIVDDEYRIAELIKASVLWEKLNLTCDGIYTDGESAWKVIQKNCPDIVITDIRMPVMTGLELIRNAYEAEMPIRFIVLSGYQEFEYARTAMEYGVEQYLVKPVDEDELNAALSRIVSGLDDLQSRNEEEKVLKEKAELGEKLIRHNFLQNIIDQKEDTYDSMLDLTGYYYWVLDIKLDNMDIRQYDHVQERVTMDHLQNLVGDILKKSVDELLTAEKEYMDLYCLCCTKSSMDREELGRIAADLLLRIKEYLQGLNLYTVTIGVGSVKNTVDKMRFSVLESHVAVCNRIVCGTGRLIWSDTVYQGHNLHWEARVRAVSQEILRDADTMKQEQIAGHVQEAFGTETNSGQINMMEYYEKAMELTEEFFSLFGEEEQLQEQCQELKNSIQHCYRVSQLVHLLSSGFTEVMGFVQKSQEYQTIKPIRQAQQYVKDHYAEKIMLEDIANAVSLSPVYFSSLFKKETGQNFSAYLSEFRMDKAKELLVRSNETISAIAEQVGYVEQKYFSQQFKKIVGVKPNVYRKLHS